MSHTLYAPSGLDDGPVAFGGALTADGLLDAFRHGCYPIPAQDELTIAVNEALFGDYVEQGLIPVHDSDHPGGPYALPWWNPPRRAVIRPEEAYLPSKERRFLRTRVAWVTTVDTAFERVVVECGGGRTHRWLTDGLAESLLRLHRAGWAHSVEVWDDDRLIGGLFGIGAGDVFSIDSSFYRCSGAGKVAVVDAATRLRGTGVLIDVQVFSSHAAALGAVLVEREEYLPFLLSGHLRRPLPPGAQPARRLAGTPPALVGRAAA